jgi:hypothetical protein
MQKATFAITFPHFFLPIFAYISEANHTSITSRLCVHETFQIQSLNFLILHILFAQVYYSREIGIGDVSWEASVRFKICP